MTSINEKLMNLVQSSQGKIFTAEFVKLSGELRKMQGRLGVTKHLTGGGRAWNPEDTHRLFVYDLQKKAYRTLDCRTLIKFTCGDLSWEAPEYHVVKTAIQNRESTEMRF
jgi:hypothetical protein